ncbi:MAG: VOC family protein [Acidobacteriota bacterium]|nr:VOC family protein [Acidobacteriota bacterium]
MELSPYLLFNGQCEAAFKFYEQVLGGKIEAMITHEGTPAAENMPPDWQKKILHARMTVGSKVLMGSDAPPQHYRQPQGFSISLDGKDPAEAERTFKILAENGTVQMPLGKTFWARLFGMLVDQYGVPWMVNCE